MGRIGLSLRVAVVAAVLAGTGCALDDDPSVTATRREDRHCRKLGAVPLSDTYLECRRGMFLDRDRVYAERLKAYEEREALKAQEAAARKAAKAAETAAETAAKRSPPPP